MELTCPRALQLIEPLLPWFACHVVPLAAASILVFCAVTATADVVTRVCGSKVKPAPRFWVDVLLLWAMACIATVIWLKGTLIVHSQGLA